MKRVKIKDLKAGKTIYLVSALGKKSFMKTAFIVRKPKDQFVDVIFHGGSFMDCFSVLDFNIQQNSYNRHATFKRKADAVKYLNECIKNDIGLSIDMDYLKTGIKKIVGFDYAN